jgi:hypothetical protein
MLCAGFLGAGAFRLMLSRESLLFALNSGCLNSHACYPRLVCNSYLLGWGTDIGAIRRWGIIFVILSNLVEVIFIQLSNEAGEIAMLEVFW